MFTLAILWLTAMAFAILAARLYTRRPMNAYDVACAAIDAELSAPRVERERVAA